MNVQIVFDRKIIGRCATVPAHSRRYDAFILQETSDEPELLEHHLQSTERYIRRHRVAGFHRENALSLIHFTRLLSRLPPYDVEGRRQLLREIETAPMLAEREWLLEWAERMRDGSP